MSKEKTWLPCQQDVEDYELLDGMLDAQKQEFDLLSKKKSDDQLNKMKIKMVNRVLEPLNTLFKNEPTHKFLDILNEADLPTNSDVVLIISQYQKAVEDFKDKYYIRDKDSEYGSGRMRWNIVEDPIEDDGSEGEEEQFK